MLVTEPPYEPVLTYDHLAATKNGQPLRFGFNAHFSLLDPMAVDFEADILKTDLQTSFKHFFHMKYDMEQVDVNFIFFGQESDLIETDQVAVRTVSHPQVTLALGPKEAQCKYSRSAHSVLRPALAAEHGGWAPCWLIPDNEQELIQFNNVLIAEGRATTFIWKPNDAWCARECCMIQECRVWNYGEDGCWLGDSPPSRCAKGTFVGGRKPEDGAVQWYVPDPVLEIGTNISLVVKTDIRVYGIVMVDNSTPRIYVSKHGYFRTGAWNYSIASDHFEDSFVHLTHHIPKIEQNQWIPPREQIEDFVSAGTLAQWFRIAEQNGLDADDVWLSIKVVLGAFLFHFTNKAGVPDGHAFHFTSDLVVDGTGRAWVMEVHTTLGVKSHGRGDPEATYDPVLSKATRQGTIGTLAMAFAEFIDEDPSMNRMEAEDRQRCRLDVESVLPGLHREIFSYFSELTEEEETAKRAYVTFAPQQIDCTAVDFNAGRNYSKSGFEEEDY
eukprot:GEMP01010932.1.p1 GENE.GEMP01010932.1~~GEMP01010932.1.p1  ORF type:complete len:497 (+),score=92.47 GEMP01010932.1:1229-2719(+)